MHPPSPQVVTVDGESHSQEFVTSADVEEGVSHSEEFVTSLFALTCEVANEESAKMALPASQFMDMGPDVMPRKAWVKFAVQYRKNMLQRQMENNVSMSEHSGQASNWKDNNTQGAGSSSISTIFNTNDEIHNNQSTLFDEPCLALLQDPPTSPWRQLTDEQRNLIMTVYQHDKKHTELNKEDRVQHIRFLIEASKTLAKETWDDVDDLKEEGENEYERQGGSQVMSDSDSDEDRPEHTHPGYYTPLFTSSETRLAELVMKKQTSDPPPASPVVITKNVIDASKEILFSLHADKTSVHQTPAPKSESPIHHTPLRLTAMEYLRQDPHCSPISQVRNMDGVPLDLANRQREADKHAGTPVASPIHTTFTQPSHNAARQLAAVANVKGSNLLPRGYNALRYIYTGYCAFINKRNSHTRHVEDHFEADTRVQRTSSIHCDDLQMLLLIAYDDVTFRDVTLGMFFQTNRISSEKDLCAYFETHSKRIDLQLLTQYTGWRMRQGIAAKRRYMFNFLLKVGQSTKWCTFAINRLDLSLVQPPRKDNRKHRKRPRPKDNCSPDSDSAVRKYLIEATPHAELKQTFETSRNLQFLYADYFKELQFSLSKLILNAMSFFSDDPDLINIPETEIFQLANDLATSTAYDDGDDELYANGYIHHADSFRSLWDHDNQMFTLVNNLQTVVGGLHSTDKSLIRAKLACLMRVSTKFYTFVKLMMRDLFSLPRDYAALTIEVPPSVADMDPRHQVQYFSNSTVRTLNAEALSVMSLSKGRGDAYLASDEEDTDGDEPDVSVEDTMTNDDDEADIKVTMSFGELLAHRRQLNEEADKADQQVPKQPEHAYDVSLYFLTKGLTECEKNEAQFYRHIDKVFFEHTSPYYIGVDQNNDTVECFVNDLFNSPTMRDKYRSLFADIASMHHRRLRFFEHEALGPDRLQESYEATADEQSAMRSLLISKISDGLNYFRCSSSQWDDSEVTPCPSVTQYPHVHSRLTCSDYTPMIANGHYYTKVVPFYGRLLLPAPRDFRTCNNCPLLLRFNVVMEVLLLQMIHCQLHIINDAKNMIDQVTTRFHQKIWSDLKTSTKPTARCNETESHLWVTGATANTDTETAGTGTDSTVTVATDPDTAGTDTNTAGIDTAGTGTDTAGTDTAGTAGTAGTGTAGTGTAGTDTDTAGIDTAGTGTAGTAGTGTAGTGTAGTGTTSTDTAGTDTDTAGIDTAGTGTAGTAGTGTAGTGTTSTDTAGTDTDTAGTGTAGTAGTGTTPTDTAGTDTDTVGTDTAGTIAAGTVTGITGPDTDTDTTNTAGIGGSGTGTVDIDAAHTELGDDTNDESMVDSSSKNKQFRLLLMSRFLKAQSECTRINDKTFEKEYYRMNYYFNEMNTVLHQDMKVLSMKMKYEFLQVAQEVGNHTLICAALNLTPSAGIAGILQHYKYYTIPHWCANKLKLDKKNEVQALSEKKSLAIKMVAQHMKKLMQSRALAEVTAENAAVVQAVVGKKRKQASLLLLTAEGKKFKTLPSAVGRKRKKMSDAARRYLNESKVKAQKQKKREEDSQQWQNEIAAGLTCIDHAFYPHLLK